VRVLLFHKLLDEMMQFGVKGRHASSLKMTISGVLEAKPAKTHDRTVDTSCGYTRHSSE
jgi:hypothetical protein